MKESPAAMGTSSPSTDIIPFALEEVVDLLQLPVPVSVVMDMVALADSRFQFPDLQADRQLADVSKHAPPEDYPFAAVNVRRWSDVRLFVLLDVHGSPSHFAKFSV